MSNAKYSFISLGVTLIIITLIMAGVDAEMLTRATAKMLLGIIGGVNLLNLAYYIKYRL